MDRISRVETQDYYLDPERYDAEMAFLKLDRNWYASRAKAIGGPVLELGCGTGRILLSLLHQGIAADGLDASVEMIDYAKKQILVQAPQAQVTLFHANMRSFSLQRRYPLILAPFNALMHLHSDQELLECLTCVRAHLTPGGKFSFDLSNPLPQFLEDTGGEEGQAWRRVTIRDISCIQLERHSYDPISRISSTCHIFSPENKNIPRFSATLRLRYYPPQEILGHLTQAGLELIARHGDFAGSMFRPESSPIQLLEAQVR
jgi:SAM-dependent methyltransferase